MPVSKKISVVLNAEGTAVDATKSAVADATVADMIMQHVPLLRDPDIAIVGSSTTRTMVDVGVTAGLLILGEKAQPLSKLSTKFS